MDHPEAAAAVMGFITLVGLVMWETVLIVGSGYRMSLVRQISLLGLAFALGYLVAMFSLVLAMSYFR